MKVFETVAHDGVIRLPVDVPPAAHCIVTVLDEDVETLRKQAAMELPEETQRRMSELLSKNREDALSANERQELDRLSAEFDTATLTKGRALAAMASLR